MLQHSGNLAEADKGALLAFVAGFRIAPPLLPVTGTTDLLPGKRVPNAMATFLFDTEHSRA